MTEEDLRTKVIYTWLKDLGFENNQLYFEYYFKINLGKNTYKVTSSNTKQEVAFPRADILVKDANGKNLLIIEVKEPNHKLNDKDKLQAISYARLLSQIAPFTILTNGNETIIYDSITSEPLKNNFISNSHPYIKNDFKVIPPDFGFYNKALETFIKLSKENLLKFCNIQVQEAMNLLKSDDIFSGRKYIPSLFIKRKEQEESLKKIISNSENKLIFITGSPQHGKTSFICNFVENQLKDGQPCIFYPAISIQNSLLDELESDFRWVLSENSSIYNVITQKIQNILEDSNSRLLIFLDGLNEASLNFIGTLNKDFTRLKNLNITFILSFTNLTARRLFTDRINNITQLANYLSLSIDDLNALEVDSKHKNKNIITVPSYINEEAIQAIEKYSNAYNVEFLTNNLIYDPFLLRIIMSYYKNDKFYGDIDEIELLKYYIREKYFRTKDIDELTIENILENISKNIFEYDSPIPFKKIFNFTTKENIEPLFESALLAKTYKNNNHFLEFYSERELFYFISFIAKEWNKKLDTFNCFMIEATDALKTNAGKLSFGWYLRINPFCIKPYWEKLFINNYNEIISLYLKNLRLFLLNQRNKIEVWMHEFLERGLHSYDKRIKVESLKLIHFFPKIKEKILNSDHESEENQLIFEEILFDENEELGYDPFDIINYETLKFLHHEEGAGYNDIDSDVTSALKIIILNKQNRKALEALAYCAPFVLFSFLIKESSKIKFLVDSCDNLIEFASEELGYYYDDYMGCPGFFSTAEQYELYNEFKFTYDTYQSLNSRYNNKGLLHYLKDNMNFILTKLNDNLIKLLIEDEYLIEGELHIDHPNQTYIDFDNL
jgi:hypothetical protein